MFDEESKSGPGFQIGQQHQKCWRKPKLQSIGNQAIGLGVYMIQKSPQKRSPAKHSSVCFYITRNCCFLPFASHRNFRARGAKECTSV